MASLLELRKKTEYSYRKLLPYMRKLQRLDLPSEEDIRQAVLNIFPTFDIPSRHIPFNVDVAKSSMMKVLRKIPPSTNEEQFRDGVIWAHCLDLLEEGDVYLVSEDKAFYHEQNYTKGLATELVKEMEQRSNSRRVLLMPNLTQLMEEIRVPFELDTIQLYNDVKDQRREEVEELLTSHGFELIGCAERQVECFATEEAQKVYFTFNFAQPCQDVTGAGRREGKLQFLGIGFLDAETKQIREVHMSRILLDYPDWKPKSGGPARGTVFASGHFNAPLVHKIQTPLDPS